jgi:hypothetical protein
MHTRPSKHSSLAPSLLLLLAACTPTARDCHTILPIVAEPVNVVQTPRGTTGCSCLTEGVLVVAEARQQGWSWSRGQVWIDGTPVLDQEFATRLAEAKARHQVEAAAARATGTAMAVGAQVKRLGKAIGDYLHR